MKLFLFFLIGVISFFSLAGCAVNRPPSPSGSVLGDSISMSETYRVVIFNVVGKGVEPELAISKGQAVVMAERAAVADGYRQFVEKLRGVYVDAYMKSGYGAINWEAVKTNTQSWLRGVEIVEVTQGPFGIVEAHMQLKVNFVNNNMIWWPFGMDNIPKS